MNLIKNGAVLLATLSMFAVTSCGNKTNSITSDEAYKWIEKHYSADDPEKTINKMNFDWNFSKTEKDSQEFVLTMLKQMVDPSVENLKDSFSKDISSSGRTIKSTSPEVFKQKFVEGLTDPKFSTSGKNLCVTSDVENAFPTIPIKLTGTTFFDEKCYQYKAKYDFKNAETEVGGKTYKVNGYLTLEQIF